MLTCPVFPIYTYCRSIKPRTLLVFTVQPFSALFASAIFARDLRPPIRDVHFRQENSVLFSVKRFRLRAATCAMTRKLTIMSNY